MNDELEAIIVLGILILIPVLVFLSIIKLFRSAGKKEKKKK